MKLVKNEVVHKAKPVAEKALEGKISDNAWYKAERKIEYKVWGEVWIKVATKVYTQLCIQT